MTDILDTETEKIVNEIASEKSIDRTKELVQLFNLNQSKKDIIRASKYSELFDKITEQISDRITNRADMFSNEDLLKYLQVIQNTMDKSSKSIETINETTPIQIQQNNQVNVSINNTSLDRDSRERVADAIKSILNSMKNTDIILDENQFTEDNNDSN